MLVRFARPIARRTRLQYKRTGCKQPIIGDRGPDRISTPVTGQIGSRAVPAAATAFAKTIVR